MTNVHVLLACALVATTGCRQVFGLEDLECAPAFAAPATFGTGNNPALVAFADVDGNGTQDVLTANVGAQSFSRLSGMGDGTLGAKSDGALEGIGEIATGDFNRDGRADLVFTIPVYQSVAWQLGRGDGTFMSLDFTMFTSANPAPSNLRVADVDRDGDDDIVVANNGNAHVLLASPDGTLAAPVVYNGVANTNRLLLADVTADGVLDLIAGTAGENQPIAVQRGRGDGTFEDPVTTVAPVHQGFEVGDLDGDDRADLLIITTVAMVTGSTIYIAKGAGDGTFVVGPAVMLPEVPTELVDLEGDGLLDLVLVSASNQLVVRRGNGDGTFAEPSVTIMLPARPEYVASTQLDGDGTVDLVAVLSSTDQVATIVGGCTYVAP